jgi:Mrp family chromosome partitioning ATPase
LSSPEAIEAYRSLHATIKYAAGEPGPRSVLLVDVGGRQPTSVAEHVALAFARAGDACTLVDANLRSAPEVTPGLSDLIDAKTSEVLETKSGADGLIRIGPGTRPDPDLLANDELGAVIDRFTAARGYLIVSCAPMPEFGDALAIAPRVDAVALVVQSGVSGRQAAIRARDALERVGARLLGIVMVERPRRWF